MTGSFRALSPRIGAQGVVDRARILDPAFASECLEALERYGVLVFPRIELSDDEQLAFSANLGEIIPLGPPRADGTRDPMFKVTLDPAKNWAAEYLRGTIHWHIDGASAGDRVSARMAARRSRHLGQSRSHAPRRSL